MRFIFDTQFRLRLSPSQCHSLVVCRHSEDPSAAHFQPLRRLHGQCTAPVDLPQIRAHQSSGLGPSRICLSRTLVSFGFGARLCGHTDLKGRPTLNQRAPEFASNHFCIFDPITTSHASFPVLHTSTRATGYAAFAVPWAHGHSGCSSRQAGQQLPSWQLHWCRQL